MTMPIASPEPALGDQAARDLITGVEVAGLQRTLFVEAGAGSGKTRSLVDRIVALVASGEVELRHVAAITFTEKAAAELRDRVRAAIEERLRRAAEADGVEGARLRLALDQLDAAAICTLHAFAQRILGEYPLEAGLPPHVEVLDEVASQLQFEQRWRDFRRSMLDDPRLAEVLLLAMAAGVRLEHLRDLAVAFDDNWDLAADPERVPWDAADIGEVDLRPLQDAAEAVLERREECEDQSDLLWEALTTEVGGWADDLAAADSTHDRLALLAQTKPTFAYGGKGRKGNWPDVDLAGVRDDARRLGELRDEARREVVDRLLQQLAVTARDFIVDLGRRRVAAGRLEFHDLLVLARNLLQGPNGHVVRRGLRQRYQRLLLDEFQDTDPIQVEIAVLLASDDEGTGHWSELATTPGRLFFVGDPKQSIYRFRRADIALFLQARDVFGQPEVLHLTTNFRTRCEVLDWVNPVFGDLIRRSDTQPEYEPLAAHRREGPAPRGPGVAVLGFEALDAKATADEIRAVEAEAVVDAVVTAVRERWQVSSNEPRRAGEAWRDARLGDITILLPARTSLPALERALENRDIPYRAETSSLVYSTPEVRDLLLAMRCLADVTDRLALVATLRSPLFGCGDDDLVRHVHHHGALAITAPRPTDPPAAGPVAEALDVLRELHVAAQWLAPSVLLDRLCRDRRLHELGYATGRPRDLWRRLRFVIDQARAWEEADGGTLREYVEWARFQASESARVAESILPETDDDAVRIMTIHGAKGLEFPITILSGTSTAAKGQGRGVQVLWPPGGEVAIKVASKIASSSYEAFQPLDEQMGHEERLRLLYVACTRARDHLVVSLHRRVRNLTGEESMTSAELLFRAAGSAPDAATIDVGAGRLATMATPPSTETEFVAHEVWEAERERVLAAAHRPASIGATAVPRIVTTVRDAGDDKDPLDLELPSWRKGRYGTAIGRAVHGVLQTIDLATADGLDDAVAGQAAAEGVIGAEADIAALVRAALGSPTVRVAAGASERWRETYVATSVGDRTLEGYLDLLFRDPDGRLVVVDYKTASSAHDLAARTAHYRGQGGAYALAVAQAAGEEVARVVFVYLTPDGAIEVDLDDVGGAVDEVRLALAEA